jgi:hypothetical protein
MARFGSLDTQYFDASGDPLVSGKIYFYESGTTTAKTTYADINNTIPNTNPVLLDASGRQPNIFFEGVAKATLTNSGDTQIVSRDPVGQTATSFGDEWVSSKIYSANDVVIASDGQYYRSLAAGNQNNNPVTTSGFWSLLYSVEWNAGINYALGATVVYETIQYQSIQASNLNHQPDTSGAWWVPLEFVWSATTTYELNQNVVGTDGILYTSLQATNLNHIPASSAAWWVGTSAAAAASATAAAASATAAAASEVAAETAETGAQTAETGAQTAQTAAELAETNAQTAQVAAELAETNAETAETNSAASAASSSTSAGNAAIAEAGAEAALDSFTDIYLGAFAVEPTVDNDGDPLAAGMLYYNTTTDVLRVYSGTAWQDAGSAVNGTSNRATYTATSGQTTFAIVYELGYVDVWLNGVKLIAGTDFTASNGTTIVLTVGATTGDLIDIIAFGTFDVANALTSADIGVTVQGYDATILVDADIGVTVQAYDANTALTDVVNTFTATQIFDNGITEEYNATGTSGAITIDLDTGTNFATALAGAVTYTFSNSAASGKVSAFTLKVTNDGSAITWPASVDWAAATAPTLSASPLIDIFVFMTSDNGTIWYGFTAGQAMA